VSKNNWAALGAITGNDEEKTVQACVGRALTYPSAQDQAAFRKKFREQCEDEHQVMHTFRELLAGTFMAQQGFTPRYEPEIDGLTPDWQFQREEGCSFVADVLNFHIDRKIEADQNRALEGEGVRVWCDWMPNNSDRLYQNIKGKAGKYKALAVRRGIPFVVIVYAWFSACLMPHEFEARLTPGDGLFNEYPSLSGVYHMDQQGNCLADERAGYLFHYYANPQAEYEVKLASGVLPYDFPARQV
jgi:hypothetical protein